MGKKKGAPANPQPKVKNRANKRANKYTPPSSKPSSRPSSVASSPRIEACRPVSRAGSTVSTASTSTGYTGQSAPSSFTGANVWTPSPLSLDPVVARLEQTAKERDVPECWELEEYGQPSPPPLKPAPVPALVPSKEPNAEPLLVGSQAQASPPPPPTHLALSGPFTFSSPPLWAPKESVEAEEEDHFPTSAVEEKPATTYYRPDSPMPPFDDVDPGLQTVYEHYHGGDSSSDLAHDDENVDPFTDRAAVVDVFAENHNPAHLFDFEPASVDAAETHSEYEDPGAELQVGCEAYLASALKREDGEGHDGEDHAHVAEGTPEIVLAAAPDSVAEEDELAHVEWPTDLSASIHTIRPHGAAVSEAEEVAAVPDGEQDRLPVEDCAVEKEEFMAGEADEDDDVDRILLDRLAADQNLPTSQKHASSGALIHTPTIHHPSAISRHVAFFDRHRRGFISPLDSFRSFRALGFGIFLTVLSVIFVHGAFAWASQGGWPDPLFRCRVDGMPLCKHGSDSGVFDKYERGFSEERFERAWVAWVPEGDDSMSKCDVWRMVNSNRVLLDPFGWTAQLFEWLSTYLLLWPADGRLKKCDVRKVFTGEMFYEIAHEKERLRGEEGDPRHRSEKGTDLLEEQEKEAESQGMTRSGEE